MQHWPLLVAALLPAVLPAQQPIGGGATRPFVLYFTHDDGPAAPAPTLTTQEQSSTVKMAQVHMKLGSPAVFFHVGCKFLSPDPQSPNPANSWCGAPMS